MDRLPKSILLVANLGKPGVGNFAEKIESYLVEKGYDVQAVRYQGMAAVPEVRPVDLAIVLGGDGTVLFTSRILLKQPTPILGVNLGTVGFLTEVVRDEWKDAFEKYVRGEFVLSHRLMIELAVKSHGETREVFYGLNDGVVSATGSSKMIYVNVELSGIFLGEYRADGIIISTPTGSTGYSLAAGGPILHPETEAMILTPICPHSLTNRPLVVPAEEKIVLQLNQNQRTDVSLTIDGRDVCPLRPGDEVHVSRLLEKTILVRSDRRSFYEIVRAKLN